MLPNGAAKQGSIWACCRAALVWAASLGWICGQVLGCAAPPPTKPGAVRYFGTTKPLHPSGVIWTNNGPEPESIDPAKSVDVPGAELIENLFAGLLQPDPRTLEPIADVAERWTISPDGKTYTFYLRESVWSDGTEVVAEDFAYSFRRVLEPATASRYANMMWVLKNGAAFSHGALWATWDRPNDANDICTALGPRPPLDKCQGAAGGAALFVRGTGAAKHTATQQALMWHGESFGAARLQVRPLSIDAVGVHALGPRVLQVSLSTPAPFFLHLCAFHLFKPVPRHVLARLRAQGVAEELWTRPQHIVSNGPFILKRWRFKDHFLLQKNERYWRAEAVALKEVRLLAIENMQTALNLYRTGDLDWLGRNSPVPPEFISSLRPFSDFYMTPILAVEYLWLNTGAAPLNNLNLRKALGLAIDRQSLARFIMRGGQTPTASLVPNGLGGYHGLRLPLHDVAAAQAHMARARQELGGSIAPLRMLYNTQESARQLAEAVTHMWKQTLGLDVELDNREWKVFLQTIQDHDYQIARSAWSGDYPDANTFLAELVASEAGNNQSNLVDPEIDTLLAQANVCTEPTQRLALLQRAEQRALQQQPLIPLFWFARSGFVKPFVKGVVPNYEERHPLWAVSVDTTAEAKQ